eukprot:TRINITY_DN104386_c0_g1_i2.p1 TRINITY_DN104386_c0_g1~~TRINITY_DN104386_c0_g1_i2.p1  ORF type:complete len:120 (+),score=10.70 TRINITY_DN104386_c0_g1_i2:46-360(+)
MPLPAFSARGPMPGHAGDPSLPFDTPVDSIAFVAPFNFSGHPACVIRSGFVETKNGALPTSIQLVGPRYREDILLQVAQVYEKIKIGRAVQQECRDRSRMPSSA